MRCYVMPDMRRLVLKYGLKDAPAVFSKILKRAAQPGGVGCFCCANSLAMRPRSEHSRDDRGPCCAAYLSEYPFGRRLRHADGTWYHVGHPEHTEIAVEATPPQTPMAACEDDGYDFKWKR